MSKQKFQILSEHVNQNENENPKFLTGDKVKGVQLLKEKIPFFRGYDNLRNDIGVDLIVYPNGARGLRLTGKDGSEKFYEVLLDGSIIEVIPYKDTFLYNGFWNKIERFFGVSNEMRYTNSKKIDLVHALMFGVGIAVVTVLTYIVALILRGL